MKKLLILMLAAALLLLSAGCNKKVNNDNSSSPFRVIMPTDDSVNGYRKENSSDNSSLKENPQSKFYANTKTKKIHLDSCNYAKTANSDNIYISDNIKELLDMGYSACSRCKPQ